MARRKSNYVPTKRDLYVIATAWLTSIGYRQEEIGPHLGIGQGLVSQFKTEAEQKGFLAEYPAFYADADGLTEEKIAQARNLWVADEPLEKQLRKLQERPVEFNLAVFPSGEIEFARGAAHYVVELLERSSLIGLGYGRTIEQLVKEIGAATKGDHRRFAEHLCVPLSGSPTNLLNQHEEKFTSSVLSTELQKALSGEALSDLPSLTGVQAYMSRNYRSEHGQVRRDGKVGQDATLRSDDHFLPEFVRLVPGYRQIFGCDQSGAGEPYVNRIDAFLTSLGIVAPPGGQSGPFTTGTFIRERMAAEQSPDVTEDTLRPLIHGDLGGILVPRKHIREDTADWRLVRDLNSGWIGLRMQHLVQITAKAKAKGPAGVIIATVVHSKCEALIAARAAMIKEIVRRGLVNQLIISRNLADALRSDFP